MFPTGPLPSLRFSQNTSSLDPRHNGLGSLPDSGSVPSVSQSSGYSTHLPASSSPSVRFGSRDIGPSSFAPNRPPTGPPQQKPATKSIRPEEVYPTPPPSPDLIELETVSVLPRTSDPVESVVPSAASPPEHSYRPTTVSHEFHPAPRSIRHISSSPTLPAIPISFLLNTPHILPHAAPFRLTQPSGILSVLGGNRVLQIQGSSRIMDRMPYSAASTNGLMLTQDQGEEASVEAMLGEDSVKQKVGPLSPDQS